MSHNTYHVRITALSVLHDVVVMHRKAKAAIEHVLGQQQWESRDVSLLREMVYGVLRYYYSLEADVSRFIKEKPDEHTRFALLLGAYQLRHMRTPAHAAVGETVSAIKIFSPQSSGFVNAVLRQISETDAPAKLKPSQRAELPKWMYAAWRETFGADVVQTMMGSCKQTPDLCLAVFDNREQWMEQACTQGFAVKKGELSPFAVLVSAKTYVPKLPGYAEGAFIVIDQAAQVAAMAVESSYESGGIILDLCASPGGKTAMLAARFPDATVVAVELNPRRIPRLQENLKRLVCHHVKILHADCSALPYADNSVDAIMLDAPCSASGTLRRHPDAKFLHGKNSVSEAAALQKTLLQEALRVLKPGAALVYAVCSIHPQENELVVNQFAGVQRTQRLYPSATHDGFFFAQLIKST